MSYELAIAALQSAGIDFKSDLDLIRGNENLQKAIIALSNAGIDLSAPIIEREFGFPNAFAALRRNSTLIDVILALEKVGCLNQDSWLGIKLKDDFQRDILRVIGQDSRPLPHGIITFTDIDTLVEARVYYRPEHGSPLHIIANSPELKQAYDTLLCNRCFSFTTFWNFLAPGNQDFITALYALNDQGLLNRSTVQYIHDPQNCHLVITLHKMGALSLDAIKATRKDRDDVFFNAVSALGKLYAESSRNPQEDDWPSICGNDHITKKRRKVICILQRTQAHNAEGHLLTMESWQQVKANEAFQAAIYILDRYGLLSQDTLAKTKNELLKIAITNLYHYRQFSPKIWNAVKDDDEFQKTLALFTQAEFHFPNIAKVQANRAFLQASAALWDSCIRLSHDQIQNLSTSDDPIDAAARLIIIWGLENAKAATGSKAKRNLANVLIEKTQHHSNPPAQLLLEATHAMTEPRHFKRRKAPNEDGSNLPNAYYRGARIPFEAAQKLLGIPRPQMIRALTSKDNPYTATGNPYKTAAPIAASSPYAAPPLRSAPNPLREDIDPGL
ncbi:hypothetical protein [Piscirickettsia salmonis]|uniref:hypothetical protein n=1 Tax=Piscirickettsia salmonis TaxID=1238 RepID=UPI0007C8DB97|nr:hypothetical protein A0O36_02164 [Piscirickettsiaceae bacterium NZ-RLO1]